MSKFKPKLHAPFKAFLSTAEAPLWSQERLVQKVPSSSQVKEITNPRVLDQTFCRAPCFRRRNTGVGVNKGTRGLEIWGVYDSIVQGLALLFLGISSSSSFVILGLLIFLDALVFLKPILLVSSLLFRMMRVHTLSKTLRIVPKRREGQYTGDESCYSESRTEKWTSKNHRIIEVGMDLWRSSGPTSLLKQGQLPRTMSMAASPRMEASQPLWTICASV